MAAPPQGAAPPIERRLLLADLDWRDADLLTELFRQPGVSIRLVVGHGPQDPGVRMAEMIGLPRSLDLADLTREIFDVALVGERSSRRTQLESLLLALGTPCLTPEEFLHGSGTTEESRPGVDAPLGVHAAALEQSLTGSSVESLVDDALPDLEDTSPMEPRPIAPAETPRSGVHSLEDFPSPESRRVLEAALKSLVEHTGAGSAEVHAGDRRELRLLAQIGPDDRLLQGLVDIATETGTPQVVTRLSEPGRGRAWAAWPFRTMQRRGVVAGAAIEPSHGLERWQQMVDELRRTWDAEDRERSIASFPLTPFRQPRWLHPGEFRDRVGIAVERHCRDGLRFELHRLEFPEAAAAVEGLCGALPAHLRDTDSLCQPFPRVALLLVAQEPEGALRLRERLLTLWSEAWAATSRTTPASPFVDRSVPLAGPEDAEAFTTAADVWLVEP
jgi:hypothetical protein